MMPYDPTSIHLSRNAPYNLTLATSASSSSSSLWSDVSSQRSDDSVSTTHTSYSDYFSQPPTSSQTSVSSFGSSCEAACWNTASQPTAVPRVEIPCEPRNPRRTSHSSTRTGRPPSLVRQSDRKQSFVENLVDTSTHIVEAIWPTSSVPPRNDSGSSTVLPLRTFIQETLRRSRTSYSTLQVALYYLILIKPHVPAYDFTTEQPDACRSRQAIQCGRRMFLAALILASKYLQDRNYSARAWSKISGLDTLEINQNEMTFLLAVNWKLHVTEEIYKRWADCVSKFTPSQPPSPGAPGQQLYERQCCDFRRLILNLTPELDNLDDLAPWSPVREQPPRSLYTPPGDRSAPSTPDSEVPPALAKPCSIPAIMEPSPSLSYGPGRLAPTFGLLPTPRLTPQLSGFSTPAASSASSLLGRSSSMGFAMAQASASLAAHSMDRFWLPSETSSPMSYVTRRSSLANSVSAASSPESMISDSSRVSRSSSISSASSLPAPSSKSDQARFRFAKLGGERLSVRPTIASVPEDHAEDFFTASPESYLSQVGKELPMPLPDPYPVRQTRSVDDVAARVLQDMHRSDDERSTTSSSTRAGSKRSRTNSLHDDVRDMLAGRFEDGVWPETLVRDSRAASQQRQQVPVLRSSHKRVCCSTEATLGAPRVPSLQRSMGGYSGQGMWSSGLLN